MNSNQSRRKKNDDLKDKKINNQNATEREAELPTWAQNLETVMGNLKTELWAIGKDRELRKRIYIQRHNDLEFSMIDKR